VPGEFFDSVVTKVAGSAVHDENITSYPWAQHVDYRYLFDGKKIRTRVHYDADECRVRPITVEKVPVRAEFAGVAGDRGMLAVISEERALTGHELPHCVHAEQMLSVTINLRKSFQFRFPDAKATLRMDCTMSWSGDTLEDAEIASLRADCEPDRRLELETVEQGSLDEDFLRLVLQSICQCRCK
jgi:hypothetical protein